MTAYEELLTLRREAHLLESTAELLGWDQETMMPSGSVDHRADQLALLASLAHERLTASRYGDLLEASEAECTAGPSGDVSSDVDRETNVRELRRGFARATQLPADLVRKWADLTSRAQHAWADARAVSKFAEFAPWLEQLVDLAREKASCLRDVTVGATEDWDALAEDFEPGMRAVDLERIFRPLRSTLADLTAELTAGTKPPNTDFLDESISPKAQEAFVRHVASAMGFDFERGRMDRSTHPFCGGSHGGDVRITTRFLEDNPLDGLGSTMHEAGHGLYEQGLRSDAIGLPAGTAVSLGIHESQSRLWENHVGRSREFWEWAAPHLNQFFGAELGRSYDADALYRASNRIQPSLIRVEADEVTYNLHVIARFEIERALIRGDLAVRDVPSAWNDAYRELLGIEVPDDAQGCLQDVHWSCGLFGYFPTYTLGSAYAAQFFDAAERSLPGLDGQIASGSFEPLRKWLTDHVHQAGMRYAPADLCRNVTGKGLDPDVMTSYLAQKLRPLYGIADR